MPTTMVGAGFGHAFTLNSAAVTTLLTGESGPVYRKLIEAAEAVKIEAQRLAPVGKPDALGRVSRTPGTLRDSIVKRLTHEGGELVAYVGTADPIALWVHEGTVPHVIVPVRAARLVFVSGGEVVYAMRVNHPGTKPNRFLLDALKVLSRFV